MGSFIQGKTRQSTRDSLALWDWRERERPVEDWYDVVVSLTKRRDIERWSRVGLYTARPRAVLLVMRLSLSAAGFNVFICSAN